MGIDLDKEPGVERKSTPHIWRTLILFFLGLAALPLLPGACNGLLSGRSEPKPAERSASFYRRAPGQVGEALETAELPRISYTSIRVEDRPGPLDPAYAKEGLLGLVNENVKPVYAGSDIVGYVAGGTMYDAGGHPFAKTVAGARGTEIHNLENELIGTLSEGNVYNTDGSLVGKLGEPAAAITDAESYRLKALIDGYDFKRTNR